MLNNTPSYGKPSVKLPRLNRKEVRSTIHFVQRYVKYEDAEKLS